MQMTVSEIVKSYNHAENRQKQISILAELNACSKAQIREILEQNGCEVPHYGNRYTGKVKEEPKKEPKRVSVRMSEKKKSDGSNLSTRLLRFEEQTGLIKSDESEDVGTCQQDVGTVSETPGKQTAPPEVIELEQERIRQLKLEMDAIQESIDTLQEELKEKTKLCARLCNWVDENTEGADLIVVPLDEMLRG